MIKNTSDDFEFNLVENRFMIIVLISLSGSLVLYNENSE